MSSAVLPSSTIILYFNDHSLEEQASVFAGHIQYKNGSYEFVFDGNIAWNKAWTEADKDLRIVRQRACSCTYIISSLLYNRWRISVTE